MTGPPKVDLAQDALAGFGGARRKKESRVPTSEQMACQKDLLPRGWGRFGKAIDAAAGICEPDEQLLAACVTLNPSFRHQAVDLVGGLAELTASTNVVVAATDRRVLVVPTSIGGGARDHGEIPYAGLELVAHDKKEFTLRWAEGEARFHGAAKTMVGPLVEVLQAALRAVGHCVNRARPPANRRHP